MRRKLLLLAALLLTSGLIAQPYNGQALSEIDKINQDLKKLQDDMEREQHKQRYATKSIIELTGKKEATKEDIEAILGRIERIQKKLDSTLGDIDKAEERLLATGVQLEEAIKQLDNHKELMDSRVRMAYMAGPVSYLDVLFSSSSFSDFLNRFDAVESIATQDRNIAQEKKNIRKPSLRRKRKEK